MALKGDRYELYSDIQEFANQVMERGGIASIVTVGSGATLDQSQAQVGYPASASGAVPRGMLLNDMVNYDLTKQHINWHRDEVQLGGKITLGLRGFWITNFIQGVPGKGDRAVLVGSGYIAPLTWTNYVAGNYNQLLTPIVGRFNSTLDEDGYAEVAVELA